MSGLIKKVMETCSPMACDACKEQLSFACRVWLVVISTVRTISLWIYHQSSLWWFCCCASGV